MEKRKKETKAEREARWERMRTAPERVRAQIDEYNRRTGRHRSEGGSEESPGPVFHPVTASAGGAAHGSERKKETSAEYEARRERMLTAPERARALAEEYHREMDRRRRERKSPS